MSSFKAFVPTQEPQETLSQDSLPPEVEKMLKYFTYMCIGCVAAASWDVLSHCLFDFDMLFNGRLRLPLIVYFVSRISVVSLLFMEAASVGIISTAPACAAASTMFSVLFVTGVASTTFLLFLRLRAIYINNTLIVRTYFFFWLTFVGCV
ncbi:hypothetical protein BT96DRAFT_228747 [Gymnopus androsaceus JB14]|uniref:Uncharacterized protein n=1 Tax=Gymnopus androsaceus JB14 TaxID=1447944 RepID=A0A6A4H687_9AGAR|nr:hypothetical protein BT96DRAFT_228747 [Gymnopus androsaceus JB14]